MALTLGDNFSYQGAKPLDARLKYDTLANMKAVADATMYDGCLAYCVATDKTYQWKSTNTVDADTGKWREFETGGGGASALSELTDTSISNPSAGQQLTYDGTESKWKNTNAPTIPTKTSDLTNDSGFISSASLNDLTDVDLGTLSSSDLLRYNGSKWINSPFAIDMNPTSSSMNPVSSGGVYDGLATKYDTSDTAETGIDDADYFPFYDTSATAKRKSLWSNIKSVLKTYFDTIYSTVNSKLTPASGGMDLSLVTTGDMYSWNLSVPTVMSATLSSGSTSVTFSDVPTSGNKVISILTSVIGLEYDSVSQSGSTVTVTFPSQSSSVTVYLKIENA